MKGQPYAPCPRTAFAAAMAFVVLLALGGLSGMLGGCGTKEGNGGTPTLTVQPPGETSAHTESASPAPTASPTASPSPTGGPTHSPSPTGSPTASPTSSPGGGDGAKLFATNCSSCHGDSGQGGIGPELKPLTNRDLQKIVSQVTNGGAAMPSFKGTLSGTQIEAVAQYVAGLE